MQDLLINMSNIEKSWKVSLKQTEFGIVEPYFKQNNVEELKNLKIRKNWIVRTLLDKNKYNLFKTCENLIMVGCGMYPYSMIDLHKRFPNINQTGIDYDERCVKIASLILDKCNLSNSIKILNFSGLDYDYTSLKDEDLVFISCDVDGVDKIYNKIVYTSKAQVFVCAPNKKEWLDKYFLSD